MSGKWTFKYGSAAVLVATVIIIVALFANPLSSLTPGQTSGTTSFLVMLTDPPTVPAGTTVLNVTYSEVSLHVAYPNGTSEWLPVNASGTINLFSLVNMSQTIASTTIPTGSAVDKVQLTITDVEAMVDGNLYNVTALSNTFVVTVANGQVNQTLSGVLVDFNPTLVQIQATDANGTVVYYYVLVPSATAIIVGDLTREQIKVGTIVQLGKNNRARLVRVIQEFSKNLTIINASLTVNGNLTGLSVTVRNDGNFTFKIFGLTLHGEFNATRTWKHVGHMGQIMDYVVVEKIHPKTIPFKINGSSLIPLFGDYGSLKNHDDHDDVVISSLILQPGQNATLTFNGIITIQPKMHIFGPAMVVAPIVGDNYTLRLMGQGFETFNVTATS